jgi:hypothetical protein
MHKIIFQVFIIFLLASCTSHPLQLSDLQLDHLERHYDLVYNPREALIYNRVDTMFLTNDKINSMPPELKRPYYIYDENGRPVDIYIGGGWGRAVYSKYDSVGLVTGHMWVSDIVWIEEMSYRFEPDSLLLYQYRRGRNGHYRGYSSVLDFRNPDYPTVDEEPIYYSQIRFDKQGKVLEEKQSSIDSIKYPTKSITTYKYNDSEQLVYIQEATHYPGGKVEEDIRRHYYYTNGKLDSIITHLSEKYTGYTNQSIKMYYDERGLCHRMVDEYGWVVNCVYKQRK